MWCKCLCVCFLYESIHSFHHVSYVGIQSGFKIVSLCCCVEFLIVRHKFPLCNVSVRQKICECTEHVVWKELWRCVGNQLGCKWIHTQRTLFSSFSQNFPRITSFCSSLIVYVRGFLVAMATTSKISCVNCGL